MQNLATASATTTDPVGKGKYRRRRRPAEPRYTIDAQRVAQRIQELGETPTGIARHAGLERTYVHDLLEGRKRAINGPVRLERLAAALDVPQSFLTAGAPAPRPQPALRPGLPLAGTVEEGVFRTIPRRARLPSVPVHPDPRFPGVQSVYSVAGEGAMGVGAPEGSWLLTVAAADFQKISGGYRDGQLLIVSVTAEHVPGEEVTIRRVVVFTNRIELHPIGEGEVFILGASPPGRRVTIRAVVLRAIQELA